MPTKTNSASRGSRKIGRSANKCNAYRLRGVRERNKARRAERYRKHMEAAAARALRNARQREVARAERRRLREKNKRRNSPTGRGG